MANIKKIENQKGISYKIVVSIGYDMNGKKLRQTTTFTPDPSLTPKQKEKAALKYALDFEEKVKTGKLLDGNKIKFKAFTEKWFQEYADKRLEQTTIESYHGYLRWYILDEIGNMNMADIKPLHLQQFYTKLSETPTKRNGKPLSASTIKKIHALISSIMSIALKWNIIDSNPCTRVFLPKQDNSTKADNCFTYEQCEIFLNALEKEYPVKYSAHSNRHENGTIYHVPEYIQMHSIATQYKIFFQMALFGGFRRGELIALTWNDIDFEKNLVFITKSAAKTKNGQIIKTPKSKTSNRTVNLPAFVISKLKQYHKEYQLLQMQLGSKWATDGNGNRLNYVFIQWDGKQMDLASPTHKFKEIIEMHNKSVNDPALKLPENVSLHGLRHTSASLLISQNTDVQTVSHRLGHSSANVTLNIYSHAFQKMDETASNTLEQMFKSKNA